MLKTEMIKIDPMRPETAVLDQAAAIIQQGGLVAFPTETVYGLGADALNETAVRGIFTAKQRPAYDPIIVHIAELADLAPLVKEIPPIVHTLAAQFWPGPLTLILPKSDRVPPAISADGPTVAVRCPSHPVARALIERAGTPIGAPSANRFSHTSPTTAQHVWDDLTGRIDLILDGGATTIGVESTVLDVTQETPILLRPGGITVEMLTAVLPKLTISSATTKEQPADTLIQRSPGMLDRHYAPKTPLWLYSGSDEQIRAAIQAALAKQANPANIGLMLAKEDIPFFNNHVGPIGVVGSLTDLEDVAQKLFNTIRQLDRPETTLILARNYPEAGIGRALRDRLYRAAEKRF